MHNLHNALKENQLSQKNKLEPCLQLFVKQNKIMTTQQTKQLLIAEKEKENQHEAQKINKV